MSLAVCARTKHQRQGKVVRFVKFAYKTEYCYLDCLVLIALLLLFGTAIFEYVRGGSVNVRDWAPAHVYGYTVYFLLCPVGQSHKPLPDFNCNKRLILAVCMILLILVVTCCQAPPSPFPLFFFCSKHFILQHVFTKSRAPRILNCNDSINTEK